MLIESDALLNIYFDDNIKDFSRKKLLPYYCFKRIFNNFLKKPFGPFFISFHTIYLLTSVLRLNMTISFDVSFNNSLYKLSILCGFIN